MRLLRTVFNYTLNNVIFGIALMVLVALYIALGSGIPSLREYFEMNELQFFSTWVLKLLMFLLCVTLATVTWNRIPLTPPRYGVWCIHAGIITLILGTSDYYYFKIEGRTIIPLDRTAYYYYDTTERALYARVAGSNHILIHSLPSLPRFKSYAPELHNSNALHGKDLVNIQSLAPVDFRPREPMELSRILGLKDPVRLDVVGFYPYANVDKDVSEDPASNNVGVEVRIDTPHGQGNEDQILTSSDPLAAQRSFDATEVEHRNVSPEDLTRFVEAAHSMFHLTISLPEKPPQEMDVDLGKTYALADSGFSITADSYNPSFTMTTGEVVSTLTIHVVSKAPAPEREFWRMILVGKDLQTDFKSDPATTPPMVKGNRQKEPIDKDLKLSFRFTDLAGLMPIEGAQKHTLITTTNDKLTDIAVFFDGHVEIKDLGSESMVNFFNENTPYPVRIRRVNHVTVSTRLTEIPEAQRDKDTFESGEQQVALIRVTCGDWKQDVPIPFNSYAVPDPQTGELYKNPWRMGLVYIPHAAAPLQLQLGNACAPLPAQITLKQLELLHYPGAEGESGMLRRISSSLQITGPTGESFPALCTLNEPVYYNHGRWLFFQAGYDPQGRWSAIGVGSRPGVLVMIIGCVMIVVGLLYAFYIKPIVIRSMKSAALAKHARLQAGKLKMEIDKRQTQRVS